MAKDTKCTECGQMFDVNVVRKTFNERYAGKLDYDSRGEDTLCFACVCYAAESGRWDGDDAEK